MNIIEKVPPELFYFNFIQSARWPWSFISTRSPTRGRFSAIMYNANKIYRMAVSRKRTTGWHLITIIRRLSAAEIWCVWYRDNGPHRLILLATWRDQTVVSLQDARSVYAVAMPFFI